MKLFIQFLVGLFLGMGLIQLTDMAFYLMNQPDTYLFNLGLIMLGGIFVAFAYLGWYMVKLIKKYK